MSSKDTPGTALALPDPENTPPLVMPRGSTRLLQRGDTRGLIQAMVDASDGSTIGALVKLSQLAISLRREHVSVLGNHEVFYRTSASGELRQIIRPVRLSVHDGTLYQIPYRRKVKKGTREFAIGDYSGPTEWIDMNSNKALVTYPGFLRQNATAGCHVGQPPQVIVDGQPKTNPYVHRADAPDGRLGDIMRVVIAVSVAGAAPATGNPVVVTYTLDYDPLKDFQHMLGRISEDHPDECFLMSEEDYVSQKRKKTLPEGAWKYQAVFAGIGYFFNLRVAPIRAAVSDYVGIVQNAVKKAQTVARRNAMRSHPALATAQVEIDDKGIAVLPVVGWTASDSDMRRWAEIQRRLSLGQALDEIDGEVEQLAIDAKYDPDDSEHSLPDTGDEDAPVPVMPNDATAFDSDERNGLIEQIDEGLNHLDAATVRSLNYLPSSMTTDELRNTLRRVNTALDEA